MLGPTAEALGASGAEASLGYPTLALALGLTGPLVAWQMRRFGSGFTIFIGGLFTASGATLVATTTSYPLYLLGAGVLMGTGVSMQTILPGTTMVTNWFARRRSLAMGIFLTAGVLGLIFARERPEDMGLEPDGGAAPGTDAFIGYAVIAGIAAVVAFAARPTEPSPGFAVEGAM